MKSWPVCLLFAALSATTARAEEAGPGLGASSSAGLLDEGELHEETADEEAPDDEEPNEDAGEGETREAKGSLDAGHTYTHELTDEELTQRFVSNLESLGSMSIGFADEGRMMNAVQLPRGEAWQIAMAEYAWGTQETIDALVTAAREVREHYPRGAPLRVSHISQREGGYLRPHKSHQSGRDVDLGFFYDDGVEPSTVGGDRTRVMDAGLNWALLRALVTRADVQVVLVDRRIARFLRDYALSAGEDPSWLDSLFSGPAPLIQHARRHRDHFHVRFFAPRSQELGRRVQPLLARRPDTNLMVYRVRAGDTLGHIAQRFGSTVSLIQKANRMTSSFLRLSRSLVVPLRGPCTSCPLPPPVSVPKKRLPPELATFEASLQPRAASSTWATYTSGSPDARSPRDSAVTNAALTGP